MNRQHSRTLRAILSHSAGTKRVPNEVSGCYAGINYSFAATLYRGGGLEPGLARRALGF